MGINDWRVVAGKVEDINKLKRLQELDNILEDGAQAFNDSPIAKQIDEVRSKKASLKGKRDQVDAVFVKARKEIETVSLKDSQLAQAQDKAQKEIESTQGDYRKVEAHTNKLNELANERKKVDLKLEELEANFNKIKELKAKIDSGIESLSIKEDDLNNQLERSNVSLKLDMDNATKEKIKIEQEISPDALASYKKARSIVGKTVIANLENESCSVCRAKLSSANISKVLEQAPIGICPSCLRVLIVEDQK